jgi:hypothetical protein
MAAEEAKLLLANSERGDQSRLNHARQALWASDVENLAGLGRSIRPPRAPGQGALEREEFWIVKVWGEHISNAPTRRNTRLGPLGAFQGSFSEREPIPAFSEGLNFWGSAE